jgi:hypothetical protein
VQVSIYSRVLYSRTYGASFVDFSSYGNDVRDFLKDHSTDELLEYINSPWLEAPRTQEVSTGDPHLEL